MKAALLALMALLPLAGCRHGMTCDQQMARYGDVDDDCQAQARAQEAQAAARETARRNAELEEMFRRMSPDQREEYLANVEMLSGNPTLRAHGRFVLEQRQRGRLGKSCASDCESESAGCKSLAHSSSDYAICSSDGRACMDRCISIGAAR